MKSKKGKPMSICVKCKTYTVDVQKMGGIICSQCSYLKIDYKDHPYNTTGWRCVDNSIKEIIKPSNLFKTESERK